MLNGMRVNFKGVGIKIVLFVIILSFALAGGGGFLIHRGDPAAVTVNGTEISKKSFDQAYRNERTRLQKQYADQFELLSSNPNFSKQLRSEVMQNLISDTLLSQAIVEMGLVVTDSEIKNEIRSMKDFQVAGKFNNARYLALLHRSNYTPDRFAQSLKHDLVRRQFLQILSDSEFVTDPEIDNASRLQAETRQASILNINLRAFKTTKVSDQAIKAYYEKNKSQFQSDPQVSVNYLVLDSATLDNNKKKISEKSIQKYYDAHIGNYQVAERRKVAQILIKGNSEISKQKAVDILNQLKNGANFGQLAKEKSNDTFSARNNGVMNWFSKGVMDPSFEKAAFLLTKVSPLSGIVKSKFGYHIIKLIGIQKEKTQPIAQVKSEIIEGIKKDKSINTFYDLQQKLSNVAFESPDSLDESARAINAQVQHSKFFTKHNASGVLANKAVLKLVFDPHFRVQKMNSDVLELGHNKAIVVRINKYKPRETLPLSDVSSVISAQLQQKQSQVKGKAFVDQLMSKLNSGKSITNELAQKQLKFSSSRIFKRFMQDQNHQVIQKTFQMTKPTGEKPVYAWVQTDMGNFTVIKLQKVMETKGNGTLMSQAERVLLTLSSEATYEDFINLLMANAHIKYTVQK
ncbi:MAG: SurA N-terminal domain-containing protein [Psychromonas sp.]|nr:SurA N-terminal domain-containing protein [Psychromonas sp.]